MIQFKLKVVVLSLALFLFCAGPLAFADTPPNGGGQDFRSDNARVGVDDRGHRADPNRHADHYYRNGRWYHRGWFGLEFAAPTLSAGVYVDSLPSSYTPVVVQGTTYYYGDNTYFAAQPQGGYTVVAAPAN
jgi:hypothetical protein